MSLSPPSISLTVIERLKLKMMINLVLSGRFRLHERCSLSVPLKCLIKSQISLEILLLIEGCRNAGQPTRHFRVALINDNGCKQNIMHLC